MPLVKWSDDLSVRVREIDDQHKELIRLINDLHDAMSGGKGKDVISNIITGLAGYAVSHFATEEKYFDQFGYDQSAWHKSEHKAFLDRASEFRAGFESGKVLLSVDVMNFLRDWLLNHIKGRDKRYSQCFVDHGLK